MGVTVDGASTGARPALAASGSVAPAPEAPSPGAPTQVPAGDEHLFERAQFAYFTHQNLQDMVRLADQKAATIIGAGGIIVAVLGRNIFTTPSAAGLIVPAMISFALMVGAVVCAVFVLWPRFPSGQRVVPVVSAPRLLWAKDISAYHRRPADYVRGLLSLTPAGALSDIAYDNLKITWILEKKWRFQRWATRLLLVAFIAWFLTISLALKEGLRAEGAGRSAVAGEVRGDDGPRRRAVHDPDEARGGAALDGLRAPGPPERSDHSTVPREARGGADPERTGPVVPQVPGR